MKVVYLILSFAATVVLCAETPCTTPNGEAATCKELGDCDILLQIVVSKDPSLKAFLKASSCGSLMVCCGTSSNFTAPEVKPLNVSAQNVNTTEILLTKEEKIKRLIPPKSYCGFQHYDDYSNDAKIANATSIDEFPWLLYISLYKQENKGFEGIYELRCAGVLIARRYALTASECNAIPFDSVQIGQYDRFNNRSCQVTFGVTGCTDNVVAYAVEEKLVHKNGILLIRLAKNINYSDFIRPICMSLRQVDRARVGDELISSGWGDVTLEVANVKSKKRVSHVLREPVSEDLIYVNSTNYTDCFGDEGGPLMHRNKRSQWFVDAILPPYFCLRNVPARRLNLEVIDWIIENMRP